MLPFFTLTRLLSRKTDEMEPSSEQNKREFVLDIEPATEDKVERIRKFGSLSPSLRL